MALTRFERQVLNVLKKIPREYVTSYGQLAKYLGKPKAARAVGNALSKNPLAPLVPCHRVVKSDGGLGGYAKGIKIKIKLLKKEGIEIKNGKIVDFNEKLFKF